MLKHKLPMGTRVSFQGEPFIYEICDYSLVHLCKEDCEIEHDHYTEPHICVRRTIVEQKPLNRIDHVFDEGYARNIKAGEKELV